MWTDDKGWMRRGGARGKKEGRKVGREGKRSDRERGGATDVRERRGGRGGRLA